jgi:hypothetical protein
LNVNPESVLAAPHHFQLCAGRIGGLIEIKVSRAIQTVRCFQERSVRGRGSRGGCRGKRESRGKFPGRAGGGSDHFCQDACNNNCYLACHFLSGFNNNHISRWRSGLRPGVAATCYQQDEAKKTAVIAGEGRKKTIHVSLQKIVNTKAAKGLVTLTMSSFRIVVIARSVFCDEAISLQARRLLRFARSDKMRRVYRTRV